MRFTKSVIFTSIISLGTLISSTTEKAGVQEFDLIEGVKINMIWVEPGQFVMGSPEDEVGRNPEREQQRNVRIKQGYWLAETELTQAQWVAVMGSNPSRNIGENLPVDQVSYYDIQEFLKRINAGGGKFRLPTEAEWEYACRAGTTGPYAGNKDEMTWHSGNSERRSHPVKQKKPNPWGFYDMHGNLLEWCSDRFTATRFAQRGGQFSGRQRHSRSADRQSSEPEKRMFFVGFRLVKDE